MRFGSKEVAVEGIKEACIRNIYEVKFIELQ
jgi:hypothetical protein